MGEKLYDPMTRRVSMDYYHSDGKQCHKKMCGDI